MIYNGNFYNNKPNGYGIGYSLWDMINYNLVGYWVDGYIKNILDINEYNNVKKIENNLNLVTNNNTTFLDGLKENNYDIKIVDDKEKKLTYIKTKIFL